MEMLKEQRSYGGKNKKLLPYVIVVVGKVNENAIEYIDSYRCIMLKLRLSYISNYREQIYGLGALDWFWV